MFELLIACGGCCRARGKAGTVWAGDSDAREGQQSGQMEVAAAGTGGGWSRDVLSRRQPCLACPCSVAVSCDSL